jgi:hypothetical protein
MAYSLPHYITAAGVDDPVLRFKWDDWNPSKDFGYDSAMVVEKLARVSLRAKIAVAIGIYEWIIGRFRSLSDDPAPFQVAEASWCANIHRAYMDYFEWRRRDWIGPVRGPIWEAATWLAPMIFFSDDNPEEWESGLSYLPRLAVHILPKPAVFEKWLEQIMERLASLYPASKEDPFDDLFKEKEEERRGPLVAREALDPGFDYEPEMARKLLADFLRGVDYTKNPYLRSPKDMLEDGFEGIPYTL